MADPKWTPGPWEACRASVKQRGVRWSDGGIAMVVSDHPREDAHLIAAAPDLYRELENLVELAEAAMRAANRDGGEYDIEAELADARAALRKARGEE